VVWKELNSQDKTIILDNLNQEKITINNFQYMADIASEIYLHAPHIFVKVFTCFQNGYDAIRVISNNFFNNHSKLSLLHRIQLASHYFFITDFKQISDVYGTASLIDLCFSQITF
jgi:hypothetical protein